MATFFLGFFLTADASSTRLYERTATHLHYITATSHQFVSVDLKTDELTCVSLPKRQITHLSIHGDYAYLVHYGGLIQVHLETHQIHEEDFLGVTFFKAYGNRGYLFNSNLTILKLPTLEKIGVLSLYSRPTWMVIAGDWGYFGDPEDGRIFSVNLSDPRTVKSIEGFYKGELKVRGGYGYCLRKHPFYLSFLEIDLSTFTLLRESAVSGGWLDFELFKDKVYFRSKSCVGLFDLKDFKWLISSLYVAGDILEFNVGDGCIGYVYTTEYDHVIDFYKRDKKVFSKDHRKYYHQGKWITVYLPSKQYTFFDPYTHKTAGPFCFPEKSEPLFFSDRYVYNGTQKLREIPTYIPKLTLTDLALAGFVMDPERVLNVQPSVPQLIESLWEEGDSRTFEKCLFYREVCEKLSNDFLIQALECNDPDARAFMYKALSEGKWGLKKNRMLAFFYKDADLSLLNLSTN